MYKRQAGDINGVISIINHLTAIHNEVKVLSSSEIDHFSLFERYKNNGAKEDCEYFAMIKLLNTNLINEKINKKIQDTHDGGKFSFVLGNSKLNEFSFGINNAVLERVNSLDIVKLLFGPEKPSSLHDFGESENIILDKLFPLQIWCFGLDSV